MIIDTNDTQHLYDQMLEDLDGFERKMNKCRKKMVKRIGKSSPKFNSIRNHTAIKYKSYITNISWSLFYAFPAKMKKQEFNYIAITKLDNKRGREYVVLSSFLLHDEKYIHIYNGHFIKRIQERADITGSNAEEILATYILDEEFSLYAYFDDGSKEMRCVNKWGVSLGYYDVMASVLIHKTFVHKSQLFKDQGQRIKEMFDYLLKNTSLVENEALGKYYPEYVSADFVAECKKQAESSKVKLRNNKTYVSKDIVDEAIESCLHACVESDEKGEYCLPDSDNLSRIVEDDLFLGIPQPEDRYVELEKIESIE